MIFSCCMDPNSIIETAKMCFELSVLINDQTGIEIDMIDLGGGIGIPYHINEKCIDLNLIGDEIKNSFDAIMQSRGLGNVR